jgi:putative PIN family toxin of toxin-antitoxin system
MTDANIIVSAILFPKSTIAKAFDHLIDNHNLVLSKYTKKEIEDVFNEKFPHHLVEMKEFMRKIPYEFFVMKKITARKYPNMRDIDDLPVLANAIESKVDLLITGDKDFDDISIKGLQIIKPRKYIDEYMG